MCIIILLFIHSSTRGPRLIHAEHVHHILTNVPVDEHQLEHQNLPPPDSKSCSALNFMYQGCSQKKSEHGLIRRNIVSMSCRINFTTTLGNLDAWQNVKYTAKLKHGWSVYVPGACNLENFWNFGFLRLNLVVNSEKKYQVANSFVNYVSNSDHAVKC